MKRKAKTLALISAAFLLSSTACLTYLSYVNPSYRESSSSPEHSSTPSTTSITSNQDDNSSSTSSSNTAPSQPESTPSAQTPTQTPSPNPTDISVSHWNRTSDSNNSLVIIDSPTNNAEYSTRSVTLTVHAAAPSWSYMIDLVLWADWLDNGIWFFCHMDSWPGSLFIAYGISVTTTLTDIPAGSHTVTVTANGHTSIAGSSLVKFTISG